MRFIHLPALLDLLLPRRCAALRVERMSSATLAGTSTRTWVSLAQPILAPLPYDNALVRAVIHEAKYHDSRRAAALVGEALAPHLAEELAERQAFGTFTETVVVPIPLFTARAQKRGFNQSERIARALITSAFATNVVLEETLLVRTRNTGSQVAQTSRTARERNVHGAFRASPRARGKDIIVLDDVTTTGATLLEAHRALAAVGARSILLVAAAH